MNRLPENAFEYYVELGEARSYQAVADHFGVSKKTVTKHAKRDGWQERLVLAQRTAQAKSATRIVESLEEMNLRHLKTAQLLQKKSLETLKTHPLTSAIEAVRTLELGIKQERLIRGEPTERTATSVEEVIRREYERWMGDDEDAEEVDDDE